MNWICFAPCSANPRAGRRREKIRRKPGRKCESREKKIMNVRIEEK
jgi:hypothetical protein